MKKICNLFISSLLFLSLFTANVFAEENDDIHIKNQGDWNRVAEEFEFDIASKGKKIILDENIVFTEFKPIPYFQGEFNGQNHTISNIVLDKKEQISGVFRITGDEAKISNLTVNYEVSSDAERIGFVGYNQGKIENVTIQIKCNSNDIVGGVAGYNSVSGTIENCVSEGEIYAKHYAGGIVGVNYGIIDNCKNYANINNRVDEDMFDIKSLTIDTILKSENVAAITDLGGIAGQNYGTIKDCLNYGIVGYEHVGYNVGGISGTTIGYIENSENYGRVLGRKDVGGISGQMEPAMELKFQEDYPTKMKRQIKNLSTTVSRTIDHATEYGDNNADSIAKISNNLREAYDAIDKMMKEGYIIKDGKLERSEKYDHYKTVLSSSMTDVFDIVDSLASSSSETVDILEEDFKNITQGLRDFGYTTVDFADAVINPKEKFVDVSDLDSDSLKDGKVVSCVNNGYVQSDINAGGIAGSLSKENDLDPEDEFSITGETSLNGTYKLKAVIDDCKNYGKISIKRNNAGGICGSQDLGLIKNSINYGLMYCEEGKYIGGIAGKSYSSLKNNYSKCFIYGDEYVGGIAGSGIKLQNNGSIAQIVKANSNVGSILGNYGNISSKLITEEENIDDNWYLYEMAGVDGISYDGKAYKITDEQFFEKQLPDELKKVNIYFYDEDELVFKYSMNYSETMDSKLIPLPKEKEFDYGIWGNLDNDTLKNVKRDLLFIAEYNNVYPSISSNETPKAYIVVEGQFSKTDEVTVEDFKNSNVVGNNLTFKPVYNISDYSSIDSIRIYANGFKTYDVYEYDGKLWNKCDYTVDGSYAALKYEEGVTAYSIVETVDYSAYVKYISAAVLILVGVQIIAVKKIKNKKNKN